MASIDRINLYIDGGCKPNPGVGVIAAVVCMHDNRLIYEYSECIGKSTSNRAEYQALITGLGLCAKYTTRRVTCFSDSELLIKQMIGAYRVRDEVLRELFYKLKKVCQLFEEVRFQHVYRTHLWIERVHALVNDAHQDRCTERRHLNT